MTPPPLPAWLDDFRQQHDAALIETHISWVLLAGAEVWKIKKPLRLPFLDYGTPARRRDCCEAEVRLNQRLAPALYLGVVLVGQSDEGDEYAVHMRRFPESQRLDHRCAHRELKFTQLAELAVALHAFQTEAAVAGPDSPYGEPTAVLAPALENFDELTVLAPTHLLRLTQLERWTRETFTHIRPQIAARKAAGRVRECHGDLHLANLVVLDGRITPFDCIEFNDALRWIDIASEIAFTYVDLIDHQRPDLAAWFLNEWLAVSGDFDAIGVLRFYAVYRVMVRAKVAALSGADEGVATCLALAESLIAPPPARLVITFGLSGSGKTTSSADLLLADTSATTLRLRSDVERKRLFGLAPLADSRAAGADGIYTPAASRLTYETLRNTADQLLDAGWSVVVDAAFLKREERQAFRATAAKHGAGFGILACSAPADELRRRLQARHGDASEATVDVLELQFNWLEALDADEEATVIPAV